MRRLVYMENDEIRKRLVELDMTAEDLAVKARRSVSTIYNLLSGRPVGKNTAYRIAHALGIEPSKIPTTESTKDSA